MRHQVSLTPLLDLLLVVLFASLMRSVDQVAKIAENERAAQEIATKEREASDSLQANLRTQNLALTQELARLAREVKALEADLSRANDVSAVSIDALQEQNERYDKALSGILERTIAAPGAGGTEALEEALREAATPANMERLTELFDNLSFDPEAAAKEVARKVLQAVEYERACDLWQLTFTSNSTAELIKSSETLGTFTFHAIETPPEELVTFTLTTIRQTRETSSKPAVLWIDYSGDDPMKRVTRKFFNSAREKLIVDVRNELINQNVIIADQL